MKPDIHRVRRHWIRGFIAFLLARRTQNAVQVVPVWPERGRRDRQVGREVWREAEKLRIINLYSNMVLIYSTVMPRQPARAEGGTPP
jgi:hypothetical protein